MNYLIKDADTGRTLAGMFEAIETVERARPILEDSIYILLKTFHVSGPNAGMTSVMNRSREARLRSKPMPLSIQKLNSS